MEDLFEHYEKLPKEVNDILYKYADWDATYEQCENMLNDMEAIGYTFDYGLDAQPYNLCKINLELTK